MESLKEKCLICDTEVLPLHNLTDQFPHSDDFVIPGGNVKKTSLSNNASRSIGQQVSVIFLLRAVLRLKQDFLSAILQSTGSNPSSWDLKLCRGCYRVLEEADFVFTRLKKLHIEFDKLSKTVCSKVIQSVRNSKPSIHLRKDDSCETKPVFKRKPGRPKRARSRFTKIKRGSKECTELGSVTEVEEISVASQIRKEVASQADKGQGVMFVEKHGFSFQIKEAEKETLSSFKILESLRPPSFSTVKNENRRNLRVKFADENDAAEIHDPVPATKEVVNEETTVNDDEVDDFVEDNDAPDPVQDNNFDDDDFDPGPSWNPRDSDDEEILENESLSDDSDSDFEPQQRRRSASNKRAKKRQETKHSHDRGIILKAIKMENAQSYSCPKCQEVFENASLCDEHILNMHYGGKWPQNFSCHLCEDVSFKGEFWLRHHYKMRHPGVKLHVDETVERSIDEGTIPELSYEVIPVGQTITSADKPDDLDFVDEPDSPFVNRTVTEPPPNTFSIPVVQAGGLIRYLVLPNVMKRLPKEVLTLIEHGKDGKQCERCEQKFPTELQLQAHVNRAHEGDNIPYCCPLCPKKYERIGKLLIGHIKRTHILSRHTCQKCGSTFKEDILLQAHVHRNHFGVENPYKCIKCGLRYPRRSNLNKHLKRVHNIQIASYTLVSKPKKKPGSAAKRIVKRSKKRVKLEKKIPCKICTEKGQLEMKFASEEELDVHIKRSHMGIARPYPCSICEKKYSSPAKVEKHMRVHTVRSDVSVEDDQPPPEAPLPFVCAPCNKQFKTQSMYNAHLKGRFHDNVRSFVCEICSQRFRDLKYLLNHQSQKHHNELNINPFKCKFCHKVLSSARTLDDHLRMKHTKNAKFKCPYCDVQFQHKSARDIHLNVHTKSQHFLCTQCPKTFLKDFYLKQHILRVHSGEKPYECKFCQRKFADKSTYNRHVEEHGGIIHSCPECGKSGFKTRHSLRCHRRTFHKEMLDDEDERKKIIVPEDTDLSQDIQSSRDEITPTTNGEPSQSGDVAMAPSENDIQHFSALKSETNANPFNLFL